MSKQVEWKTRRRREGRGGEGRKAWVGHRTGRGREGGGKGVPGKWGLGEEASPLAATGSMPPKTRLSLPPPRLLGFLFLFLLMAYTCVCGVTRTTASTLTRHQNECNEYKATVAALSQDAAAKQVEEIGPTLPSVSGRGRRGRGRGVRTQMTAAQDMPNTNPSAASRRDPSPKNSILPPPILESSPDPGGSPPRPASPMQDIQMDEPPVSSPTPPEPQALPKRTIRLPARYREELPAQLAPAKNLQPTSEPEPESERRLPRVRLLVRDTFRTATNKFNLWRSYLHRPTYNPDSLLTTNDLSDYFTPPTTADGLPQHPEHLPQPDRPTLNTSTSLLLAWQNNGHTTKSASQLNALVSEVLLHPEFNPADLVGFSAERAEKQAEKAAEDTFPLLKQFQQASVEIEVPSGSASVASRMVAVPGLWYRSLVSCIKAAFADPLSRHFHLTPFKLFHKVRSTGEDIRVFSELYNSDAFIQEHDNVRLHGELPPDAQDCKREKTVAALMF
ncbi:hypothetical protein C8F01DRAFT_105651 [Mycena amicta]|nr:hypothetical protein C8F01DRAFT_105651 [Mycena amicta]